jgi:hypothetical protein
MLYFLLLSLVYTQAQFTDSLSDHQELTTLGVTREDYEPNKRFKAAYMVGKDPATTNVMAHFDITTKRRTINLDNFRQIIDIDCSTDDIRLTFDHPRRSKKAMERWSRVDDLTFYIGHEHNCLGVHKVYTASVDRIQRQGLVLIVHTTPCNAEDVIDTYELNFAHGAKSSSRMPESKLQKRGIRSFFRNIGQKIKDGFHTTVDKVVQVAQVVKEKVVEVVKTDWHKTGVIPFDINYDKNTKTIKKPLIQLLNTARAKLDCINCYTTGSTVIELHIKATLSVVTEYTLAIDGDIHANMDFDLTIKAMRDKFAFRANVFSIPLSPFTIPGVFK